MKLLIFSASTGGGHKRAAAALEDTIHRLNPEVEVTVVDGLRAIGKMYDTTTVQGYYFLVKNAPGFYGEMYDMTDRKNLAYKAMMKINAAQANKLLEVIEKHNPNVIIMCHAFITAMVSKLKSKGAWMNRSFIRWASRPLKSSASPASKKRSCAARVSAPTKPLFC